MIFGDCPYCEEPFAIGSPDKTPQMGKVTCESCGKWFWEYFSRIEPRSYLLKYKVSFKSVGRNAKIGSHQIPYYDAPIDHYLPAVEQSSEEAVVKMLKLEYKNPTNIFVEKI